MRLLVRESLMRSWLLDVGCIEDRKVNQEIVEFAMTELNYGDCQRSNYKVENFQSQVVAGTKYSFDFVWSAGQCGNNEEGRCHIEVLSQPWLDNTEVLWDETTCKSCVGCSVPSPVEQEIVEFAMSELSYGDCLRSNVEVINFKSQVVAGIKFMFDLVLPPGQCGNKEEKSCHIEVLNNMEILHGIPWNLEILSDETTCKRVSTEETPAPAPAPGLALAPAPGLALAAAPGLALAPAPVTPDHLKEGELLPQMYLHGCGIPLSLCLEVCPITVWPFPFSGECMRLCCTTLGITAPGICVPCMYKPAE